MTNFDEGLWDFSLRVYRANGVSAVLIDLQDRCNADVNLLLYCWWHGLSGRGELSEHDLVELDRAIAPWRDSAISPLRKIRRRLKDHPVIGEKIDISEVSGRILDAEIAAERVAQRRLESRSRQPGYTPGTDVVRYNWHVYLTWLGVADTDRELARLDTLLD